MISIPGKPSVSLSIAALASVMILNVHAASAQSSSPPPATATRPTQPEQHSVPNNNPPATRTQTTGETNRDPTVQKMNENAKQKIDREGK